MSNDNESRLHDFRPITADLSLVIHSYTEGTLMPMAPFVGSALDEDGFLDGPSGPSFYGDPDKLFPTLDRLAEPSSTTEVEDAIDDYNRLLGYAPKTPEWLNRSA